MADGEHVQAKGGSRHASAFIITSPSRMMATSGNVVAAVDRERLVAYRGPEENWGREGGCCQG